MIAGRNFSKDFATDVQNIMLNEAATRFLGFSSPEEAAGKKVMHGGEEKIIVGVVDDYNQMSLKNDVAPILYWCQESGRDLFSIKFDGISSSEILADVENIYSDFFPGNPVDHFYLDAFFNRQYAKDDQFGSVFTIFSVLAILVSCLGLFGLSAFSALQRTKEIGIRKVLGASVSNILMLLSREYLILILVSILLGVH